MPQQSDLFEKTEDAMLAERLMQVDDQITSRIQGMYRTPEQYVNSAQIAEVLVARIGYRNIIEFCVTTLERRDGNG